MASASDLPLELILQILSHFAGSDFESAVTLTCVSSWARRISLPHIYRTIILRNPVGLTFGPIRLHGTSRLQRLDALLPEDARSFINGVFCDMDRELVSPHQMKLFPILQGAERLALQAGVFVDLIVYMFDSERGLLQSVSRLSLLNKREVAFETPDSHSSGPSQVQVQSGSASDTQPQPRVCTDLTFLGDTLRYEWDLVLTAAPHGKAFLLNITHLTLGSVLHSRYLPLKWLRALTHAAIVLRRPNFPNVVWGRDMLCELMTSEHGPLKEVVVALRSPRPFLLSPRKIRWLRAVMAWRDAGIPAPADPSESTTELEPRALKFINISDDDKDFAAMWRCGGEGGPSLWELATPWEESEWYGKE